MTPITHGGTDRGYKLCKCAKCGVEAECKPSFDFYTPPEDDKGPLRCYGCSWSEFISSKKEHERAEEKAIKNQIKEMKK